MFIMIELVIESIKGTLLKLTEKTYFIHLYISMTDSTCNILASHGKPFMNITTKDTIICYWIDNFILRTKIP